MYDQRATVVDMESLLRQAQADPRSTPEADKGLKSVMREDYRRDKQFGFKQVESIAILPAYVPETEREPESAGAFRSSWLKPSDLADKENEIEPLPDNPDIETVDVDPVVPWGELSDSLAGEALKEPAPPSTPDGLADGTENDPFLRNTSALPLSGLSLEPAMGWAPVREVERGAREPGTLGPREDRLATREDRMVVRESAMGMDRMRFQTAEARALAESHEKEDFSRTQISMREISAPWRDPVDAAPALSSPSSWTPTRSVDLPLPELSRNPAVRSVTSIPPMEAPGGLSSMGAARMPTVLDPLSRPEPPPGMSPPAAPGRNLFRPDEFRISPGMGDGFPVGNFR